jgi:hypothetical protein
MRGRRRCAARLLDRDAFVRRKPAKRVGSRRRAVAWLGRHAACDGDTYANRRGRVVCCVRRTSSGAHELPGCLHHDGRVVSRRTRLPPAERARGGLLGHDHRRVGGIFAVDRRVHECRSPAVLVRGSRSRRVLRDGQRVGHRRQTCAATAAGDDYLRALRAGPDPRARGAPLRGVAVIASSCW